MLTSVKENLELTKEQLNKLDEKIKNGKEDLLSYTTKSENICIEFCQDEVGLIS